MKTGHHPAEALALVLATALFASTPGLAAQSGQEAPSPAQQQPDQQQSKTFQGKILKLQDGKYALVTGQTAQGQVSGHFLDDQDNAKKFEGKQVKVTGTLEVASNTIHVTKIEEAA
jgi:hypothetical protein